MCIFYDALILMMNSSLVEVCMEDILEEGRSKPLFWRELCFGDEDAVSSVFPRKNIFMVIVSYTIHFWLIIFWHDIGDYSNYLLMRCSLNKQKRWLNAKENGKPALSGEATCLLWESNQYRLHNPIKTLTSSSEGIRKFVQFFFVKIEWNILVGIK